MFLMCYSQQLHLHQLCRLMYLPNFLINGEALLPIGLCLILLNVIIFSLGSILHYFIILNDLSYRPAVADHPFYPENVNELLANHLIEPFTSGDGYYSNMCVVPKHTGGLCVKGRIKVYRHTDILGIKGIHGNK